MSLIRARFPHHEEESEEDYQIYRKLVQISEQKVESVLVNLPSLKLSVAATEFIPSVDLLKKINGVSEELVLNISEKKASPCDLSKYPTNKMRNLALTEASTSSRERILAVTSMEFDSDKFLDNDSSDHYRGFVPPDLKRAVDVVEVQSGKLRVREGGGVRDPTPCPRFNPLASSSILPVSHVEVSSHFGGERRGRQVLNQRDGDFNGDLRSPGEKERGQTVSAFGANVSYEHDNVSARGKRARLYLPATALVDYDNMVVVRDVSKIAFIRRFLTLYNMPNDKFSGMMGSLVRPGVDYDSVVCAPKHDGTRFMLLMVRGLCFAWTRNMVFYELFFSTSLMDDTLLDCEFVGNYFVVLDVLIASGTPMFKLSLSKRMKSVATYCEIARDHSKFFFTPQLYKHLSAAEECRSSGDGLVFLVPSAGYIFGQSPSLNFWKPWDALTADFAMVSEVGVQAIWTAYGSKILYYQDAVFPPEHEGRIGEFGLTDDGYKFVKCRVDKDSPNSLKVVQEIESIYAMKMELSTAVKMFANKSRYS